MLDEKLIEYAATNTYPFHMPGHKRNIKEFLSPYDIDITEITDFDDLHHSEGILLEAQKRAAQMYGTDECFYLVNGSTCGLLASISALTNKHDRVLVARNCHKAVYHAIYLRELQPVYIYPEITDYNIQGQVTIESVQEAIESNPEIKAVIITSPTYDGIVSDVASIAKLVHSYGIKLIVDEAHGAHFGLDESMPENAIRLGADCVIVSVHKTLPAFTQTALLLVNRQRVDVTRIENFLDIYETSSPSYILMAGIERCVRMMTENGKNLFVKLNNNLDDFYAKVNGLCHLKVLTQADFGHDAYEFDRTKILISTSRCQLNGHDIKKILTTKYKIELEMSSENYALALATVMDTKDGFDRLADALVEIDRECKSCGESDIDINNVYTPKERVCEIHEMDLMGRKQIPFSQAEGCVCGDYIYFYPPGIPILVPGERVDAKAIADIRRAVEIGIDVYGLTENQMIFILKG